MGKRGKGDSVLVFLKLGGSLLTDKRGVEAARTDVLQRLAAEIAAARQSAPELRLVIGNGAGSFGHVPARKYGTRDGVRTAEEWFGFAETADAAARLNRLVAGALLSAGVPAWSVQPSAGLRCVDGRIVDGPAHAVAGALQRGLVPLVHGDVALDDVRGGTIASTEEIFAWLAEALSALFPGEKLAQWRVRRVILAGEVDGIYTADPLLHADAERIPYITPQTLHAAETNLGGSHGVDVTGGMAAKVRGALAMAERHAGADVLICSGLIPGNLTAALDVREAVPRIGTHVRADEVSVPPGR